MIIMIIINKKKAIKEEQKIKIKKEFINNKEKNLLTIYKKRQHKLIEIVEKT